MSSELVIDARRSLPLRQRVASDAGTVGLWIVWLLLSAPGVVGVAEANPIGAHKAAPGHQMFALTSIEAGIALVVLVALALTVWRKLAGTGANRALPLEADCAQAFGLEASELHRGRDSRVCVVHHDEDGRIIRIETAAPDAPDAAPSVDFPRAA